MFNWVEDASSSARSTAFETVEERISRAMSREVVGVALLLGFKEEEILSLVKKKIESGEDGYKSALELVEDLQNEEHKTDCDIPMDCSISSSSSSSSPSPSSSAPSSPVVSPTIQEALVPAGLVLMSDIPQCASSHNKKQKSLDSTNEILKNKTEENCWETCYPEEETCKVCLDKRMNTLFSPCSHICCCLECAGALKKCPICRTKITSILKFYRN